jgi:uncharacterized protein YegL
MPIFKDDDNLQQHKLPTGHFGFSAASITDLADGASEYTLVTVVVDESGSTVGFQRDMEKCLKEIYNACLKSPRVDNLMMRLCAFDQDFREIHGFQLLSKLQADIYDNALSGGGMTSLYDAAHNAIEATSTYAEDLINSDYESNGIVFVITDGCDNTSKLGIKDVKKVLTEAVKKEKIQGLVSILIGVNIQDPSIGNVLQEFHKKAGFTQYIELENADAKTLARLAEFVSKSISSQSQALANKNGPAPSLTF